MIDLAFTACPEWHAWTEEMLRRQEAGYPVVSEPAPECWGA